jgi:hypothetical protein
MVRRDLSLLQTEPPIQLQFRLRPLNLQRMSDLRPAEGGNHAFAIVLLIGLAAGTFPAQDDDSADWQSVSIPNKPPLTTIVVWPTRRRLRPRYRRSQPGAQCQSAIGRCHAHSYATQPGSVAQDGTDGNSPYSRGACRDHPHAGPSRSRGEGGDWRLTAALDLDLPIEGEFFFAGR